VLGYNDIIGILLDDDSINLLIDEVKEIIGTDYDISPKDDFYVVLTNRGPIHLCKRRLFTNNDLNILGLNGRISVPVSRIVYDDNIIVALVSTKLKDSHMLDYWPTVVIAKNKNIPDLCSVKHLSVDLLEGDVPHCEHRLKKKLILNGVVKHKIMYWAQ
jgi:hypothetical protein